jgi:hypothetical protein
MGDYQVIDPNFSADDLVERISNLYVQMQNACTARDLSSLRPYFTDALYGQFDRQIQQLKAAGRVNHVDNIAVLGVTLRGWQQDDQNDRIIAEVRTRITDYTVDEKTGAVVSARDKGKVHDHEYAWCAPGAGRRRNGSAHQPAFPSCGAPLDVAHSAQCRIAGNIILGSTTIGLWRPSRGFHSKSINKPPGAAKQPARGYKYERSIIMD